MGRSTSGAAAPSRSKGAIARTRRLGLRNLNGGDSRFDADYPSISYLSPISRPAGAERQIYAGNANDYIYITDGNGRDHGFLHLEATVNATETPRRLKPINVYYHMFAGERAAQLAGVRHHLDSARQALVTPIGASHYAAIADGFFSTQMMALGDSSWLIQNRGALQTVRFDDAAGLTVDFTRSVGVLGQRKKGSSLYVALDEAQDDVVVALGPDNGDSADISAPHLIEGRWTFRDMRRQDCGFTVMAKGYGTGQMTWGGLRPGVYHVAVRTTSETVWEDIAEVGDDGRLALTADADASQSTRDRGGVFRRERPALMFRHIALIVSLTAVALAAGVAMVPGEREQWTMLVRDGRNQEALKALEARYRAGKREVDAVLHLYKLYMSFAEIEQATRIMQEFAADHGDDPAAVALLAKHYGDVQDKPAQIRTLEELFDLSPSVQTARELLAHYRLEGTFDREETLLRTLLANQIITPNDAERLGLMLAAQRRPLRRARSAHAFRRDRQSGTQHRAPRLVRRAGANRRQDHGPAQGGVLDRVLAQSKQSPDARERTFPPFAWCG